MKVHRAVAGAAAVVALLVAPPVQAGQPSTPDVNVMLSSPASQDVKLTLTAHADGAGASHASLVFWDRGEQKSLNGLELHRVWVPGLGGHDDHLTTEADDGHQCSDTGDSPIKIRGLSMSEEFGEVQVWIDVRPGEDGPDMGRIRFREMKGCGGDQGDGHDPEAIASMLAEEPTDHGSGSGGPGNGGPGSGGGHDGGGHDDGGHDDGGHDDGGDSDHGGVWLYNSDWIELHKVVVNVRGGGK